MHCEIILFLPLHIQLHAWKVKHVVKLTVHMEEWWFSVTLSATNLSSLINFAYRLS